MPKAVKRGFTTPEPVKADGFSVWVCKDSRWFKQSSWDDVASAVLAAKESEMDGEKVRVYSPEKVWIWKTNLEGDE